MRKVTVKVGSEQELLDVYDKALAAGLVVHMITDRGLTEFGGVPTRTCLAVGPDYDDLIDPVTGDLEFTEIPGALAQRLQQRLATARPRVRGFESRTLLDALTESEPARAAGAVPKTAGRASAGVRVARSPRRTTAR